jgi:hypothetical protein
MRSILLPFLLLACSLTYAEEDWPYVRVQCDTRSLELVVEEDSARAQRDIPKAKGVQSLYALTQLVEENGQYFRVKRRDFVYGCAIGAVRWKVRVSPWKVNEKTNGMCGGYSPSTQLTVSRGEKRLLDELVFSGYCNPPASDYGVLRVRFSEKASQVIFDLQDERGLYQKVFDFSSLTAFTRDALSREPR